MRVDLGLPCLLLPFRLPARRPGRSPPANENPPAVERSLVATHRGNTRDRDAASIRLVIGNAVEETRGKAEQESFR